MIWADQLETPDHDERGAVFRPGGDFRGCYCTGKSRTRCPPDRGGRRGCWRRTYTRVRSGAGRGAGLDEDRPTKARMAKRHQRSGWRISPARAFQPIILLGDEQDWGHGKNSGEGRNSAQRASWKASLAAAGRASKAPAREPRGGGAWEGQGDSADRDALFRVLRRRAGSERAPARQPGTPAREGSTRPFVGARRGQKTGQRTTTNKPAPSSFPQESWSLARTREREVLWAFRPSRPIGWRFDGQTTPGAVERASWTGRALGRHGGGPGRSGGRFGDRNLCRGLVPSQRAAIRAGPPFGRGNWLLLTAEKGWAAAAAAPIRTTAAIKR